MNLTAPSPRPFGRLRHDWRPRFLLLVLIWGLSFMFIKIGATELGPVQIALARVVTGALALVPVLWLLGGRLPRGLRVWAHLSVAAFFLNTLPFTLFGYAGGQIPSSVAGVANSATPLFTLLVSLLVLPQERPTRRRLAGLATGFAGVIVVSGVWQGDTGPAPAGLAAAFAAALCYGIGLPYMRRFLTGGEYGPLELSAAQLLAGSAQLLLIVPFAGGLPGAVSPRVVLAMLALGALGTGLAYVLQYGVVSAAGATVASTVTYLLPVVAMAAGVLLLGESPSWNQVVGAVVIIAGALLCQAPSRPSPASPGPSSAQTDAPPLQSSRS
ncbi:DMT family transporter [Marinactinospora endophytica]